VISLYFEVLPKPGFEGCYLEMAARLKPELDRHAGLEFLDRSRAVARPAWLLSHQFWRDEAAMTSWRTNGAHHRTQACGRRDVLADYRLRVGQVVASWTRGETIVSRSALSDDSAYNHPGHRPMRFILSALSGPGFAVDAVERFASVYDPMLTVHVTSVSSEDEGLATMARWSAIRDLKTARLSVISRDYGMFERDEAPQFFEPVTLS
jgi:heme-degrading monooxygenase HmoA